MSARPLRWGWLLLAVPLVVGLARLRFDVEVLNLLPDSLPAVEGLKLHQKYFADSDELILTVEAASADTATLAAQRLAQHLGTATNLTRQVRWQSPWADDPGQTAELIALAWLNQPPGDFSALAAQLAPDRVPAVLETARTMLTTSLSPEEIARRSYDPLGLTSLPAEVTDSSQGFSQDDAGFATADGCFRLITLKPARPIKSFREQTAWLVQVKRVVHEFLQVHPELIATKIQFTGAPAFASEASSTMERDMRRSASSTLILIAVLFWLAHRRWLPLLLLVLTLILILTGAMALGGLIFRELNVISLGFAAILLGLSVDYALVLYQEATTGECASASEVRQVVARGIAWSALTTAGAFLLLNFAGLPGLAQLGTLVGLGILLAALTTMFGFLPLIMRWGTRSGPIPKTLPIGSKPRTTAGAAIIGTTFLLIIRGAVLLARPPSVDHSTSSLGPKNSEAYNAMQMIGSRMGTGTDALWVLVRGTTREVAARMESLVHNEKLQHQLGQIAFPSALWPQPDYQEANRRIATALVERRDELRSQCLAAGFTEKAFELTERILNYWQAAALRPIPLWPEGEAALWILEKGSARTEAGWLVMGLAHPATRSFSTYTSADKLVQEAQVGDDVWLTSWDVLGEVMLAHAEERLPWLIGAMALLVAVCLRIAFGTFLEVMLGLGILIVSILMLLTVMSFFGWSWNLMNLMAAPLLLGAGVDYTIHMQLSLRRHEGDLGRVLRTTGKALFLCAGTTFVGFGSLGWTGNTGLSSLGKVCAAGVGCVAFTSLVLLPLWWNAKRIAPAKTKPALTRPSVFYRAGVWRIGLRIVRTLPRPWCENLGVALGKLYHGMATSRRELVVRNFLPVVGQNRRAAEAVTARLFANFGRKLSDLLRYESGMMVEGALRRWTGWDIFEAALSRRSGVLIVTPHLGNWEFGGAFLAAKGIKLLVLTQAEPGRGFTELREQSRARHGIETMVVGEDAFAFVEIIKRLQAGAPVALLVDRPPPATAVAVELFGRPFHASIAAAELARASGCAIVPVYVVREHDGYGAHVLSEIHYDRTAINNREARSQLTREILRAFEPAIHQYADQWYHFVPVWQASENRDIRNERAQAVRAD